VKPTYPEIARKARIEGVVILEITVNKQGNVRDVKILRPAAPWALTEAAVDAVKQWQLRAVDPERAARRRAHHRYREVQPPIREGTHGTPGLSRRSSPCPT
jgi:TonB family protein